MSELPLTDLKKICQETEPFEKLLSWENEIYGNEYIIRKYSGWNRRIYGIIEHSIAVHSFVDLRHKYKLIIAQSKLRRNVYRAFGYKSLNIGPVYNYARQIWKKSAALIPGQSDKVVFFLPHSTHFIALKYYSEAVYSKLLENGLSRDNLSICIYWKDFELGYADFWLEKGFSVFSAGHCYSSEFLLNSVKIIESHRAVVGMGVASCAIYAILSEKPYLNLEEIEFNEEYSDLRVNRPLGDPLFVCRDFFSVFTIGEWKHSCDLEVKSYIKLYAKAKPLNKSLLYASLLLIYIKYNLMNFKKKSKRSFEKSN